MKLSEIRMYAGVFFSVHLLCFAGSGFADAAADENDASLFVADLKAAFASAEADGRLTIRGAEDWLFQANEVRHLTVGPFWGDAAAAVSRASKPDYADPLPAIVGFDAALIEKGIELILVPVPPKAVVYPDKISSHAAVAVRYDPNLQAFYAELRSRGVDVLDLTDVFLARKTDEAMYCRHDTHWTPRACEVAAAALRERVQDATWLSELPRQTYLAKEVTRNVTGDLVEGLNDPSWPKETLAMTLVGTGSQDDPRPIRSDESSPVILMGDSHTLVFNDGQLHGDRAGLADHLAAELGFPLDLQFRNRGGGATQVRIELYRRQSNSKKAGGDYLAGKKLVIWCFSAREFTESTTGWRVLPVEK